ncbi:conserved exported hypothetical protein [uncultured Desulfobacterium sp.]|uniref:ABC-type transport auxiliary lipoprotein component domain-containing protein n=1 Tax=uncultured Desulfobacterium sp. TaxID=201089 RepID=A0A445N1P1_9BACT|nr:conserved exported hypothetical protein [uncultured Desulfobacterium sp.]
MKRSANVFICYAIVALFAGCSSTPPSRFYTLSPAMLSQTPHTGDYSVSVGPVSIPAAVDRPQIVVRTGPNQVYINEFDRWASPLKADIARVIAENLVSMLGTPKVTVSTQSTSEGASYRTAIDVLSFESDPGKAATLDALWTVSSNKDRNSIRQRTTITETTEGADYASLAAAHSRALEQLSREIAEAIKNMEKKK